MWFFSLNLQRDQVPFPVSFSLMWIILCRILRDRALYKVTSDFVDAATNGAVGVINRCIPPINPTDPECFHMLVIPYKKCQIVT